MTIDVRPDHWPIILNILKQYVPDRQVVAFGSRTQGTAKPTSDLDLCIMGEEPLAWGALSQLRDAFSLSSIPYKIDVLDGSSLSAEFQKIITQQCVVIQNE